MPLITLLKSAQEHLGAVTAIVASLSLLFPKVRAGILWVWRWVRGPARRRSEKLDLILQKVVTIEREMQYNGGSTLRDMVEIGRAHV